MANLLAGLGKLRRWRHTCKVILRGPLQALEETIMLLTIFAILVVLWLLGFTVFHVASGLIHLLLILAVIALVVHFVRGRSVA